MYRIYTFLNPDIIIGFCDTFVDCKEVSRLLNKRLIAIGVPDGKEYDIFPGGRVQLRVNNNKSQQSILGAV